MKYICHTVIFLIAFSLQGFSANEKLVAYFSYSTFSSPQNGPFIETYLSVAGATVQYVAIDSGLYQGSIEVTLVFKQGEEIKDFKKYILLSPQIQDTTTGFVNFIDQQRISLPNGNYDFEIEISDINSNAAPFNAVQQIGFNYSSDSVAISDIQLLEAYNKAESANILTKSGYDLIPYVSNFYPETVNRLMFYAELYNTDKALGVEAKYLLNYFIEDYSNNNVLGDYRGFARKTAQPVGVLLNEFDIAKLPTGNYNLVVEVRDRENMVIKKEKIFFQRLNPTIQMTEEDIANLNTIGTFVDNMDDHDSLAYYTSALAPIASATEKSFITTKLNGATADLQKQFFLSFWTVRNPMDPGSSWRNYKSLLNAAEKEFATKLDHGWESDRGRIYVKYGKPNTRTERTNDPSNYPYEIWHYYTLNGRSNVKFIFYDTDLSTNTYTLLHSNALGELNDYRWKYKLAKRNAQESDLDMNQPRMGAYGNRAEEIFNMPH